MRAVFPDNSVCRVRKTGCHNVKVYSKHLGCLFPQHGPGKKHERLIALEPWQQEIVDAHPWEFIRGLIHSDGCRITNWTTRIVGGERKRYEYPRYFFTNKSDDIRRLYTDTLDKVGVEWTHSPAAATRSTSPSPAKPPSPSWTPTSGPSTDRDAGPRPSGSVRVATSGSRPRRCGGRGPGWWSRGRRAGSRP